MDKPEIETLSYKPKEGVNKPEQPKCETCGDTKQIYAEHTGEPYGKECPDCQPEQPDNSKCRHCGACRIVRPAGEWQFACKCNEDDKIYPPEQPKDGIHVPIFIPNQLIESLPGREHDKTCECKKCPEQPNQQLMLIQTIQNLTTCISNSITKLPESLLKDMALEEIDLFVKTTLYELQKEYE